MNTIQDKQAYTVQEVAIILSCCPKTVRKLCKEGKIRSVELGSRDRRIPKAALDDYINGKCRK